VHPKILGWHRLYPTLQAQVHQRGVSGHVFRIV
jgi:hypothetical protein